MEDMDWGDMGGQDLAPTEADVEEAMAEREAALKAIEEAKKVGTGWRDAPPPPPKDEPRGRGGRKGRGRGGKGRRGDGRGGSGRGGGGRGGGGRGGGGRGGGRRQRDAVRADLGKPTAPVHRDIAAPPVTAAANSHWAAIHAKADSALDKIKSRLESDKREPDFSPANWRASGSSAGGGGSSFHSRGSEGGFGRGSGHGSPRAVPERALPPREPAASPRAAQAVPAPALEFKASVQEVAGAQGVVIRLRPDSAGVRLVGEQGGLPDADVAPVSLADGVAWGDLHPGLEVSLDLDMKLSGGSVDRVTAKNVSPLAAGECVPFVSVSDATLSAVIVRLPSGVLTPQVANDPAVAGVAGKAWTASHALQSIPEGSGVPELTADWCGSTITQRSSGAWAGNLPKAALLGPAIAAATPTPAPGTPGQMLILSVQDSEGGGSDAWAAGAVGRLVPWGVEGVQAEGGLVPGSLVSTRLALDARTAEVWGTHVQVTQDMTPALLAAVPGKAPQQGTVLSVLGGGQQGLVAVPSVGGDGHTAVLTLAQEPMEVGQTVAVVAGSFDAALATPCADATGVCAGDTAPAWLAAVRGAVADQAALAEQALAAGLPEPSSCDWQPSLVWQPVGVVVTGAAAEAASPVAVLARSALGVLESPPFPVTLPLRQALLTGRVYRRQGHDTVRVLDGGVLRVPASQLTGRAAAAAATHALSAGLVPSLDALPEWYAALPGMDGQAGVQSTDAALVQALSVFVTRTEGGALALDLPLHSGMLACGETRLEKGDVLSIQEVRLDTQAQGQAQLEVDAVALACPRPHRPTGIVVSVKPGFCFISPLVEVPVPPSDQYRDGSSSIYASMKAVTGTPHMASLRATAARTPLDVDDDGAPTVVPAVPDVLRAHHATSAKGDAPPTLPVVETAGAVDAANGWDVAVGDLVSFDEAFDSGGRAGEPFRRQARRVAVLARAPAGVRKWLTPSFTAYLSKQKTDLSFGCGRVQAHVTAVGDSAATLVLSPEAVAAVQGAPEWVLPGAAAGPPPADLLSLLVGDAPTGAALPPGTARLEAGKALPGAEAKALHQHADFARRSLGEEGKAAGVACNVLAPWESASASARPDGAVVHALVCLLTDPGTSRVLLPDWATPVAGAPVAAPGAPTTVAHASQCLVAAVSAAYGLVVETHPGKTTVSVPKGWRASPPPPTGTAVHPCVPGLGAVTGDVQDAGAATIAAAWLTQPFGPRAPGRLPASHTLQVPLWEVSLRGERSSTVSKDTVTSLLQVEGGRVPCSCFLKRSALDGSVEASGVQLAPVTPAASSGRGEDGAWGNTGDWGPAGEAGAAPPAAATPGPAPGHTWGVVEFVSRKPKRGPAAEAPEPFVPSGSITPLNADFSDGARGSVPFSAADSVAGCGPLHVGKFVDFVVQHDAQLGTAVAKNIAHLTPEQGKAVRAARKAAVTPKGGVPCSKPCKVSERVYLGRITREPSAPMQGSSGTFGRQRGGGRPRVPVKYPAFTGGVVEVTGVATGPAEAAVKAAVESMPNLTVVPGGELGSIPPKTLLNFAVAHAVPVLPSQPMAPGGMPPFVAHDVVAFVVAEDDGSSGSAPTAASGWARAGAETVSRGFGVRCCMVHTPAPGQRHTGIVMNIAKGAANVQEIVRLPEDVIREVRARLAAPQATASLTQALELPEDTAAQVVATAAELAAAPGSLWTVSKDAAVKLMASQTYRTLADASQITGKAGADAAAGEEDGADASAPPALCAVSLGEPSAVTASIATGQPLREGDVVEYSQSRHGRTTVALRGVVVAGNGGRVPACILHQGATGQVPPAPAAMDTLLRHVLASGAVPLPEEQAASLGTVLRNVGVITLANGRLAKVCHKRRGETLEDMRSAQTSKAGGEGGEGGGQPAPARRVAARAALAQATVGIGGVQAQEVVTAKGPDKTAGFSRPRTVAQ